MKDKSWFQQLSGTEKRTFYACFAGWALDGFDFQLYPLIIPTLIALWHITSAEAGMLGTVTLLASAVGGWMAGQLADRIGRVRTLQLTILWFSVFTALSGLTQNLDQLFVCRTLMGLGFGGEWTAGSVLIGEVVAARSRGRAVGLVQSSWAIGWGVALLSAGWALVSLPPEWAWRVLFLAGILPSLSLFFIRRHVPEPAIFQAIATAPRRSPLAILSPAMLRVTLPAALLLTGMQGGYYAIVIWLPTFLKVTRGLSVFNSALYQGVVVVGAFTGYVSGAFLTDALGRRRQIGLFALCCLVTVLAYTHLAIDDRVMLVLGFPLGFFSSGIFSGVGALLSELFPTDIRGSGQGFCYNFGRGVAALIPWLIGRLSEQLGLGTAIGFFAAGSYALLFLAVAYLPETRGQALRS